jgi:hypothetical protein
MNAIEKFGASIRAMDKFVADLDPTIRAEAFKFLLSRQFGPNESTRGSAVDAVAEPPAEPVSRPKRELAPQELLRRVQAPAISDKAVVLGYWLEMHQGHSSFSGGKLKDAFDVAREQAPVNPSDLVAKLEKSGRFMRAEKVGITQYYRLTRTAIEEVESKLTED